MYGIDEQMCNCGGLSGFGLGDASGITIVSTSTDTYGNTIGYDTNGDSWLIDPSTGQIWLDDAGNPIQGAPGTGISPVASSNTGGSSSVPSSASPSWLQQILGIIPAVAVSSGPGGTQVLATTSGATLAAQQAQMAATSLSKNLPMLAMVGMGAYLLFGKRRR